MKLKAKLANEFWLKNRELTLEGGGIHGSEAFYLAGFEKARSLAAKIAYDPSFDGTGDKIDCLGEEEV